MPVNEPHIQDSSMQHCPPALIPVEAPSQVLVARNKDKTEPALLGAWAITEWDKDWKKARKIGVEC